MDYQDFLRLIYQCREEAWKRIYLRHRTNIRIKKMETFVRNLEAIFQATLKIGNEKGFQAMSMRDLAHETGLSMGALYAYFSGKEELLEMIQETGRTITLTIMNDCLDKSAAPLEQLRTVIKTHLYLSEALQPWFFFSYMEARHLPQEQKERAIAGELKTEKVIADILQAGCREGQFFFHDGELTASFIKAMLQDWYLKRWKYSRRNISVEHYAASLMDWVGCRILPGNR
jgi:TetR/AcrR family transcriptional regulator, cholesterol catabolism regulator